MTRSRARILAVATAAGMVAGLSHTGSPAMAGQAGAAEAVTYENAVPGLAPAGAGDRARYVDEHGRTIGPAVTGSTGGSASTAASSCQPISLPDNPHWSSPDVSAHGQWEKGTCTSNTAHVWNCLYEYYTDATWRRKACSAKVQLKPKSQSNNRTTARRQCDSRARFISWRNHVDVDVDGQSDPPDEPYKQADVDCVVTGPDQ
ncbi:hypothetical protein [Actinoplanes sp. NPDC049316]|uniref:hypothetical protein n=1 Tax=Actinoplanes sp. NPDC049316 TaxID=3154727 RepID=UPI0034177840